MATYTSKAGQNIFDICLMTYGNFDYIYKLVQDNGLNNINSEIPLSTVFTYDETLTKEVLPIEMKRRGVDITTGDTVSLTAPGAFDDSFSEEYD